MKVQATRFKELKDNTLWGVFSMIVMNGKIWDLFIAVLLLSNMFERAWSYNSQMLCKWIIWLRKNRVNRFYWTWSFLTVSQSFTADTMEIHTKPVVVWMNVSSHKWLIAFLFIRIKKHYAEEMSKTCSCLLFKEIIGQPQFGMIKGFPNQHKLLLVLWQGTREHAESHILHKEVHSSASLNDLNKSFA